MKTVRPGKQREAKQIEPWMTYVALAAVVVVVVALFALGSRPGGLFGSGAMSQEEAMAAYAKMPSPDAAMADPKWQKRLQEQHPERYGAPGTPFRRPNISIQSSPTGAVPSSPQ